MREKEPHGEGGDSRAHYSVPNPCALHKKSDVTSRMAVQFTGDVPSIEIERRRCIHAMCRNRPTGPTS